MKGIQLTSNNYIDGVEPKPQLARLVTPPVGVKIYEKFNFKEKFTEEELFLV